MTLKKKLIISYSIISLVSITITFLLVLNKSFLSTKELLIQNENNNISNIVLQNTKEINESISYLKANANVFGHLIRASNSRDEVINILQSSLMDNPIICAAWAVYNKNTISKNDADYKNTLGSDSEGQFMPLVNNLVQNIDVEICINQNNSDYLNSLFQEIQNKKEAIVSEQESFYFANGIWNTISFCFPILSNGEIIGITGFSILIDVFQKQLIPTLKYNDNCFLLSKNSSSFFNKNISDNFPQKYHNEIKNKLLDEEDWHLYLEDNKKSLLICKPIQLLNLPTTWNLIFIISESILLQNITKLYNLIIVIFVILYSVTVFILIQISNSFTKPLVKISEYTQNLAIGNLSNNELLPLKKRNDEIGILAISISKTIILLSKVIEDIQKTGSKIITTSKKLLLTSKMLKQEIENNISSSNEYALNTNNQAITINNIKNSSDTVSSNIYNNSINAEITEKVAGRTAKLTEEGAIAVSKTLDTIKEIKSTTKIIEEIARQTNMLSLNASIEAARAGENGQGFSVVAKAVGKLADKSKKEAMKIADLTNYSVKIAETSGALLENILLQINDTAEQIKEISNDSLEQSKQANSIHNLINELNDIINNSNTHFEHFISTNEQLEKQSEILSITAEDLQIEADFLLGIVSYFNINKGDTNEE